MSARVRIAARCTSGMLLLAAASTLVGCGRSEVEVVLRVPPGVDPFSDLDALVLLAVDAGEPGRVLASRRFAPMAGRLVIDSVPYGEDRVFVLLGVNETPGGDAVISAGKSCHLDVSEGAPTQTISMYFALARAFAPVAAAVPDPAARGELGVTLQNGSQALVTVGDPSGGPLAYLYDHVTGELVEHPPGEVALSSAAQVSLPADARWVVTGGIGPNDAVRSDVLIIGDDGAVEQSGAAMLAARAEHTATALADGSLLVAGGHDGSAVLFSAETGSIDFPVSSFEAHGRLEEARRGHTATPLSVGPNTTVFIIGGDAAAPGAPAAPIASTEKLNPLSQEFVSLVGTLVRPRTGHTATAVAGPSILVVGGVGTTGPLAVAELFDPFVEMFRVVEILPESRAGHTATLLEDGAVLITGGRNADGDLLGSAELYDPDTESFLPTGFGAGMVTGRSGHVAIRLCDGTVLLAGGAPGGPFAEIYVPEPSF